MIIAAAPDGRLHAVLDGSQLLICENQSNVTRQQFLVDAPEEVRRIDLGVSWNDTYRIMIIRETSVQLISTRNGIESKWIASPAPVINAKWVTFGVQSQTNIIAIRTLSSLSFYADGECTAVCLNPLTDLIPTAFSQGFAWLWRDEKGSNVVSFIDSSLFITSFETPRVCKLSASPTEDAVAVAGIDGLFVISYAGECFAAEGFFAQVVWTKKYILALTHHESIEFYTSLLEKRLIVRPHECACDSIWNFTDQGFCVSSELKTKGSLSLLANHSKEYLAIMSTDGGVWIWDVRAEAELVDVFVYGKQPMVTWQGSNLIMILKKSCTVAIWRPQEAPELLHVGIADIQGVLCDAEGIFVWAPDGREYIYRGDSICDE